MKKLITILFLIVFVQTMAQTVYFKINGANVTMSNGSNIIVNGTNTDAIQSDATGRLISEEQINKVQWIIKTNTGNYIVPFKNTSGNSVRIEYNITSAGVGNGILIFSTSPSRTAPSDDSKLPTTASYPTPVINMNNASGFDNSANVVNRFWFVDYSNYTTNPSGTLTLYYSDLDFGAMTESNLKSQFWNNGSSLWQLPPIGTVDAVNNNVNSISSDNNAIVWTLVDKNFPLPIELSYFKVDCQSTNNLIKFEWMTESETNSDYFLIQKTADFYYWQDIKKINAAGNSTTNKYYTYSTPITNEQYFRLKEYDYNGASNLTSNIIKIDCENTLENNFTVYPNPTENKIEISINKDLNEGVNIEFYNYIGQLLYKKNLQNAKQNDVIKIDIGGLSSTLYILKIYNNHGCFVNKLIKL